MTRLTSGEHQGNSPSLPDRRGGSTERPAGRLFPGHQLSDPADRRRQRTLVVTFGDILAADQAARTLARSLEQAGFSTFRLEHESSPNQVARDAISMQAHAIELCLPPVGGVRLIRELLKELRALNRTDINIVIHRGR